MSAQFLTQTPEDLGLVEPADALELTLEVEYGATGRSFALKIGGSTVLTWNGTATFASGYSGTVTLDGTLLSVSITKDAGWSSGAEVSWVASYYDSITDSTVRQGAFAQVTSTLETTTPTDGATNIPRLPLILATAAFDSGTPLGIDILVGGVPAIEGGDVQTPHFTGRSGASGTRAFGSVHPRRAFSWASTVSLVIQPRVLVGSTAYRGRHELTFKVVDHPRRVGVTQTLGPFESPLKETVRQLAASALRPHGGSPELIDVMPYYISRSTVGQLAPISVISPNLQAIDIPTFATLTAFVDHLRPMWAALLSSTPTEYQESLARAWDSEHVLERVAAVCVVLSI